MKEREIQFAVPELTEKEKTALSSTLDDPIITNAEKCRAFEESFSNFVGEDAHCVAVSSCMAALHLSYLHFKIGPGDEVIVPAQTHVATVHAVELVGATPIFADCDPETGNVTAETIEENITEQTKAISVVHFLGIPCNMPEIMEVADSHDLQVIEDCALAPGAHYDGRHVGLFGDTGCFSFYPAKHITTGEGGMLITRNEKLAERVRKIRGFGVNKTYKDRNIPGMYDVESLGLNYRMTEFQGALGVEQMKRLPRFLDKRKNNFQKLEEALQTLEHIRVISSDSKHIDNAYYGLGVVFEGELAKNRNEISARLKEKGIGFSIYYPRPVPEFSYYEDLYPGTAEYSGARNISYQSITFPVGPHLVEEDLDYIIYHLQAIINDI